MLTTGVSYRIERDRPRATSPGAVVQEWRLPDGSVWAQFYRTNDGHLVRFPDHADFIVALDGSSVCGMPARGTSDHTLEHLYQNQVLPLALSARGALVFHASAVEIGGGAVAFAGPSGRGKSTMAASFATTGMRFLTDDSLLIEPGERAWSVVPTQAAVRLWDDSREAVLGARGELAPALDYTTKARLLAGDLLAFCDRPRPLRRVYFLDEESPADPVFTTMKPSEALMAMVGHSFLLDLQSPRLLAGHFAGIATLVEQPIFFRLAYPRRYDDLARVRVAITEHAARDVPVTSEGIT